MKFEDQVEKAKEDKFKYRVIKDVTFIILGIIFLLISIIVAKNK